MYAGGQLPGEHQARGTLEDMINLKMKIVSNS